MGVGTAYTAELESVPVEGRGHQFTWIYGDGTTRAFLQAYSDMDDFCSVMAHDVSPCDHCDEYPSLEFFDDPDKGPRLVAKTDCAVPQGKSWSIELAVPSGKMIVSDSLHPVYHRELPRGRDVPGYNSLLGQELHAQQMAEIGCALIPASNIALGLFRLPEAAGGPDRYVVASVDDEAEPGEPGYFDAVEVANVCTDLWALSAADFDHFIARTGEMVAADGYEDLRRWDDWKPSEWIAAGADPAGLPEKFKIVDVTPGTYRFTHAGRPNMQDEEWPIRWAEVERITPGRAE